MIDTLLSVIDSLIKLKGYQSERIQIVYKQLLEPAFRDLEAVHLDYIKMFEEVYERIPYSWESNLPDYMERVQLSAKILQRKRVEYEPIRVRIRTLATELTGNRNLSTEALDFVYAVIYYFPEGCIITYSATEIGNRNSRYASSGTKLLDSLYAYIGSDLTIDIKDLVGKTINYHKQSWQLVCEKFMALKVSIVMRQ